MTLKFKIRKARSIKKALKYFDPHKPLWDNRELDAFYVSRDSIQIEEIDKLLRRSKNYPKILFSGPPGCGKATELAKIKEKLWKKFTVVQISARDISYDYKLPPNVILYHILRLIGDAVKERNKKFFDEKIDSIIKRFQGWQTKKASIDTEAKKATPGMLEKLLKFEEPFTGSLETESKLFEKPSLNEMIGCINTAVEVLEKRRYFIFSGKPALILFYDLDKLEIESARDIFITTFLPLVKINCNAVYTFPLSLKFEKSFIKMFRNFSQVYFLENFKINDRNDEINGQERKKLAEVIKKRISDKIIYQDVIERIVDLSGGVLFELINIVRECCVIALREKINYIDDVILDEAEDRIRTNYKIVLSKEDLRNLYLINRTKKTTETSDLTKLLNQYSITEYGCGENVWYDVNPILLPLLENFEFEEE